jgi:hypothetical protein
MNLSEPSFGTLKPKGTVIVRCRDYKKERNQYKFDYKIFHRKIKTPKAREIATHKTNKQQTTTKGAAKYMKNKNTRKI